MVKPTIPKADGATRLAVFGDSMAIDVGKALERFYAEDPNIVVLTQGVGSSGIVRTDFFDWPKTIADADRQEQLRHRGDDHRGQRPAEDEH